jgi:polysaccharide export outer membrane protein
LDATRANPQQAFIYRLEDRSALQSFGVNLQVYSGPRVPTIYTVDFTRPDAFFLASDFYMRDKDVIFISEAQSVGLARFTNALSGLTGNASALTTVVTPR